MFFDGDVAAVRKSDIQGLSKMSLLSVCCRVSRMNHEYNQTIMGVLGLLTRLS